MNIHTMDRGVMDEMNDVQFVIFDMDGLMFNTEEIAYTALSEAMEHFQYDLPVETYKSMIGMRSNETDRMLLEIYGEDFPMDDIFARFKKLFSENITNDGLGIKPGVHALLDFLDEKQIKRCIASSSRLKTIEHYLQLSNLTERFDFYISGEEVEDGKPAPDIFIEACRRAHINEKNAIVLEDSLNGFLAAYRAGIHCIVIPDMVEPNEKMREHATIFETLHDVIPFLNK